MEDFEFVKKEEEKSLIQDDINNFSYTEDILWLEEKFSMLHAS